MDTSHVVLALIIVVIAAAGTLIVIWFRKRVARLEDDKRVLSTDFNSRIGRNTSEHESALAKFNEEKRKEAARAAEQLQRSRADFDSVSLQYKNTFERGDRVSRRDIVDTCNKLQLDAALLTNIIYTPDPQHQKEGRYYSQTDHLLVTTRGLAVIENKFWSMLVFDGVHPAKRIPSLAPIFKSVDLDLSEGEVLHVWAPQGSNRSDNETKWREHQLSLQVRTSPHTQARVHAQRLNELLTSRLEATAPWIDTCVYYSYKGADVHLPKSRGKTSIVSDLTELKQFLCGPVFSKSANIDVRLIVNALKKEAGDVVGTGCWSREWPDTFS